MFNAAASCWELPCHSKDVTGQAEKQLYHPRDLTEWQSAGCSTCGFSTPGVCNCADTYCDVDFVGITQGGCWGYPGCGTICFFAMSSGNESTR